MRSEQDLARLVQIFTGIKGSTPEEAFDYVQMVELRNEYSRMADEELAKENMLRTLSGIQGIPDADRWNQIRKRIMLTKGNLE